MTITKREVQPKARITYDEMEAFLTLPVPKEGEEYTLEELLALLEKRIRSVMGLSRDFKKKCSGRGSTIKRSVSQLELLW